MPGRAGRPVERRHAAPPGACRDAGAQPGGALPGRADGRHRPGPAGKFWEHFRALRDEGRTLIVTTQYVTESEYCDEILVLSEGQRVAMGTAGGVRRLAMGGEIVTVIGPDLDRRDAAIRRVAGVQKVTWAARRRSR